MANDLEFRAQVYNRKGKWHCTVLFAENGRIVARHGARFTPASDLQDVATFVGFAWSSFVVAGDELCPFDVSTDMVEQLLLF